MYIASYEEYIRQQRVTHAINLRMNKSVYTDFYYKLDELVDRIKDYKVRVSIHIIHIHNIRLTM